jgi:hypothetical protein
MKNLEQAKKETGRWMLLRILDAGRPVGCNGSLILTVLEDEGLLDSASALRRECDYLAELGLVAAFFVGLRARYSSRNAHDLPVSSDQIASFIRSRTEPLSACPWRSRR